MIATEDISTRKEMVLMHNEYLSRLEKAMKEENYIEASWLCYAIMEQRVNRLIMKHIRYCPKKEKTDQYPVSINTRLNCIKNLISKNFNGYGILDLNLFLNISDWCKLRNNLTHSLISLNKYKKYDEEFKNLALNGYELVKKMYDESSKYRIWWYKSDICTEEFPCGCKNNSKCLKMD